MGGILLDWITSLFSHLVRNSLLNLNLVILFVTCYLTSIMIGSRLEKVGLGSGRIHGLGFWVGIGSVAGGRIAYVFPEIQTYLSHPANLLLVNTGMYFEGALVGGLATGGWIVWRRNLRFWLTADTFSIYIPLIIAFTRFGCLLENSCFGRTAPPPLGILFPSLTQHRYPSELYEGVLALALFGVLLWISQRDTRHGVLFLTFLASYLLARELVDLTRINSGAPFNIWNVILPVGISIVAGIALCLRLIPHKTEGGVSST